MCVLGPALLVETLPPFYSLSVDRRLTDRFVPKQTHRKQKQNADQKEKKTMVGPDFLTGRPK